MMKAIKVSFPNSDSLTCTKHLKENVNQYMTDKIGVDSKLRNQIVKQIFGPEGVTSADDDIVFEHKIEETQRLYQVVAPSFDRYFQSRVLPVLRENLETHMKSPSLTNGTSWTNNNFESVNAMLKHMTNWRPQQLTNLVLKLYDLVSGQYIDLKRSLVG